MANKENKCYVRKCHLPGVYKAKVGEGDKAKVVFIQGMGVFNTNDAEVIKFLDADPGVVLAQLDPLKPKKEFKDMTEDELIPLLEKAKVDFNGWKKADMVEYLENENNENTGGDPSGKDEGGDQGGEEGKKDEEEDDPGEDDPPEDPPVTTPKKDL